MLNRSRSSRHFCVNAISLGPPHAIVQAPGMPIVFLYQLGAGNTFRQVPISAKHDETAIGIGDLYNGDSIARWEGNTLVVETTNFTDRTAFGSPHSDKLKLTERFTRIDPQMIDYRIHVDDPATFTAP